MNLFGDDFAQKQDNKYTSKIKAPIYEPKNRKPHIKELYNDLKTKQLIRDIEKSNISDDEKIFLIESAKRHTVFNFSKIADYYSHSSTEMQDLMERSALVIIDYKKAVEYGFVKLSEDIRRIYMNEVNNDDE